MILLIPMIFPDNDVSCMVSPLVFYSIRNVEHRAGTNLLDHFAGNSYADIAGIVSWIGTKNVFRVPVCHR